MPAAWRIRERQAPSPRPLLGIMRRYARQVGDVYQVAAASTLEAWRRQAGDDELTTAAAVALGAAMLNALRVAAVRARRVPVPTQAVVQAMERAGTQAIRAERSALVRAGANRARLSARLVVPPDQLLGINVAPSAAELQALAQQTRAALGLVTRIPQQQLDGYEQAIARQVVAGRRVEAIARDMQARLGIDDRHAELIARDQVGKLNGKITETTQQAAGVDRYVWRVTNDSRLRDSHDAVRNTVHLWSQPPAGTGPYGEAAHPGEAIQCRCSAEPVIPADLRATFGETTPLPEPGDVVPL